MGRVWRGHDQVLDREVAVKEILFPEDLPHATRDRLVARTKREAQAAARLQHPGIVTVFDVTEHDGAPWIVMELVRGPSLGAHLAAHGALDWERVAAIGADLADALAHAHTAGVVHRDLKPDNVLLAGNRVVITDFGIARLLDAVNRLTSTYTVVGTPHYMAPEQFEGGPVEGPADLWALGATLYCAVEGHPPFDRPTLTAIITAVLTAALPPASHAGPLGDVLHALMVKDPQRRPDAADTAARLRPPHRPDSDSGVHAAITRPTPASRTKPPTPNVTRRRLVLFAATAAVAGTGVGIGLLRAHSDGNSGTPSAHPTTPAPVSPPGFLWRATGSPITAPPAVAGGMVYVGRDDNKLYALDAATGAQRWMYATGGKLSCPAVEGGVVYVGSTDGNVYALDAATGVWKWASPTGGSSRPVVAGGVVYIGGTQGDVYALDAPTGTTRWTTSNYRLYNKVASDPVVVGNVAYVVGADQRVEARDAATGAEHWDNEVTEYGNMVTTSPAVGGGMVYVGCGRNTRDGYGWLTVLDAATGKVRWTKAVDRNISDPTVVDRVVYFGDGSFVYALDTASGGRKWAFAMKKGAVVAPLTVMDGVVYVGGDAYLYALDAATGSEKWAHAISAAYVRCPVVADGVVYVASEGNLYALNAATGAGRT
jgi:serine/threonine-protein kinase